MTHPYKSLPPDAFWRSGVAGTDPWHFDAGYRPKAMIGAQDSVALAASPLTIALGAALRLAGVQVLDAEPPPPGMTLQTAHRFGYGLHSARFGTIPTARQMLQFLGDVIDDRVDPADIWPHGQRFIDALRPEVEPEGLGTATEAALLRHAHLRAAGGMLVEANVLILALETTEAWIGADGVRAYPAGPLGAVGATAPQGCLPAQFSPAEVLADLADIRGILQEIRPDMRMILMVSPQPQAATQSDQHALVANTRSKAVLRAAVGEFAQAHPDVDYFPAYEILTNPAARGQWWGPNLRDIAEPGLHAVTHAFLAAHGLAEPLSPPPPTQPAPPPAIEEAEEDALVCEELLLEAFRS